MMMVALHANEERFQIMQDRQEISKHVRTSESKVLEQSQQSDNNNSGNEKGEENNAQIVDATTINRLKISIADQLWKLTIPDALKAVINQMVPGHFSTVTVLGNALGLSVQNIEILKSIASGQQEEKDHQRYCAGEKLEAGCEDNYSVQSASVAV
eukprot:CAMPEP_0197532294 /NCGR_PEP_ID=MMETSP1318-20131121/39164_1 /TAXON_ID=552666 /ORGANISM="Partenskyella glossopodia, Strain RCC365" /LENGTH=154 /DNA_ID=CAMNT_0043088811 /DNA_START=73 /DNA_END=537 /DNA_ORIENTATION=+